MCETGVFYWSTSFEKVWSHGFTLTDTRRSGGGVGGWGGGGGHEGAITAEPAKQTRVSISEYQLSADLFRRENNGLLNIENRGNILETVCLFRHKRSFFFIGCR